VNKVHPYAKLEREFITGTMSLRELCRSHDIGAHSSVVVQARKGKWQEKREAYQARASESFIAHHADRMADRLAEVRDQALEAIVEAITKFREDMRATKLVKQPDGSITEEPAWRMKPREAALLIDRLQVLSDRPSSISQHQGVSVTSELSVDTLRQFIELTRDVAAPAAKAVSPLPRSTRQLDD
jgi:hypothetical protein